MKSPRSSLLSVLRDRPRFRRLFAADALSAIGDWLTYVAVGLLALRGPHGIVGVALVQMAHTLPQALASPIAGWLTDRVDRRALLVGASLARGAITLAMGVAAARGDVAWVEGLLFVRMAGAAFIAAPSRAALPRLVEPDELEPANRLLGTAWAVLFTAGVALGGVVTGALGPAVALYLDAGTFALAALGFAALGPLPPAGGGPSRSGDLVADARAHPERLAAALAKVPALFANGGAWVVLHALVGAGGGAAYGLGGLHAVRGVGNGVGPWLLRRLGERRMVLVGGLVTAAGAALLSFGGVPGWVAGCALWGLGVGATWVGATVWLQRVAPDAILGRYAALDVGASSVASALGGLSAALLTVWVAPAWAGVAVATAGALALLLVARRAGRAAAPSRV